MIAQRVAKARGFWSRALGLIGRPPLAAGEGLWLIPCNGIHTFGMRYSLDIIVLDSGMRVVRVALGVDPGRLVLSTAGGHSTLELPGGALRPGSVAVGDVLMAEALC